MLHARLLCGWLTLHARDLIASAANNPNTSHRGLTECLCVRVSMCVWGVCFCFSFSMHENLRRVEELSVQHHSCAMPQRAKRSGTPTCGNTMPFPTRLFICCVVRHCSIPAVARNLKSRGTTDVKGFFADNRTGMHCVASNSSMSIGLSTLPAAFLCFKERSYTNPCLSNAGQ